MGAPVGLCGLLLSAFACWSCRTPPSLDAASARSALGRSRSVNPPGCIDRYDPAIDYFPDKVTFESAREVNVSYHGHYKLLTATFLGFTDNPDYRSSELYVLVQCGTPPPPMVGPLARAQVISIPAKTVTVTNNEDLGLMIALGLRDQITSVWTGAIDDDPRWRKGQIGQLPVTLGSGTSGIPIERRLDRKPDVFVVGASQSQDLVDMQRARDLGIPTVPSLSRTESTPLGRAEWLKALAAVFNQESKANDVYNDLAGHYRLVSLRARAAAHRPRVFWGSTYAAGEWTVARNSFQARLIEDAGAVNPLADQGPTVMVKSGPELIVERAGDAEYWITENRSIPRDNSTATVPGPPLGALQAVRTRHVYHLCRQMGVENNACDYYQTGTSRPDLVLEDLVWLLHPELESDHQPHFLAQLPPAK